MSIAGPVGIAGLGVMGGSLARALSVRGVEVQGWSPDADEARAARDAGAVGHVCASIEASARDVEWWIAATPLAALPGVLQAASGARPARVMDVASLQEPALEAAAAAGLGPVHVSAHPMAGSERSGFAASSASLYDGATVWLSASPDTSRERAREAADFWTAAGAEPQWIDAAAHDRRMVAASHLPQLASNALARVLDDAGLHPDDLGPGGRDATRLAGKPPELWRDLLVHSRGRLAPLLRALAAETSALADRLEAGDVDDVARTLARTRHWRSS